MEYIINNWYIIVGIIAILVMAGYTIYKFVGLPTKQQMDKIKEWLKYAVLLAEKELGEKTGQAKLRFCFDLFIAKFPITSKFITFEAFSILIDEALEWLNEQLLTNKAIKEMVQDKI